MASHIKGGTEQTVRAVYLQDASQYGYKTQKGGTQNLEANFLKKHNSINAIRKAMQVL
jgi:hypothetical protein